MRRLLARARPAGERPPGELLGAPRGRAHRGGHEPARRCPRRRQRTAARGRRDRPVELRPGRAARCRGARGAARGGRRACRSCGGPSASRRSTGLPSRDGASSRGARCSSLLAGAFGLLHARDLQIPALSTPRLAAIAVLATAPALVARRAGRRLGLLALAPASLVAAWLAAGHWPSPGAPLGGLAGQLADAPSAWVQVVLPFAADERPELRAARAGRALRVARRARLALARPPATRSPPRCWRSRRSSLSATVYDLPQYPWRALLAGALRARPSCSRAAPAGGGRRIAAALRGARARRRRGAGRRARALAAGAAAVDDLDVLARGERRLERRPRLGHALPAALVRPEAGGGAPGARPASLLLARRRALRLRRPALRTRGPQAIVEHAPAGRRRARRRRRRRDDALRAEVQVEAPVDSFLVAPGQPVRYELPPEAGAVDLCEDGSAQLRVAPAGGPRLRRRGRSTATPRRARCARSGRATRRASLGSDLSFAGELLPAFGTSDRERDLAALFQSHRGDPLWDALAGRLREGAARPRAARRRRTRRWSRWRPGCARRAPTTSTPSLPERPDALARWAGAGRAGLLPDVRRLAGRARAPLGRAGPRRRGLRAGRSARRRLPRDRSRRARVGRGLVPRLRLAAVRRHAGTRSARPARRRPRPRSTAPRRRRRRRAAAARPAGLQLPLARLRAVLATGGARGPRPARLVGHAISARGARVLAVALLAALRSCSASARSCGSLSRASPRAGRGSGCARSRPIRASSSDRPSRRASSPRALERALRRRGAAVRGRARALRLRTAGREGRRGARGRDERAAARAAAALGRRRRLRGAALARAGLSAARDRAR